VLSIGTMEAGAQALYHENQVAGGRDDYYSGRGEAPGRWTGGMAGELGLEGRVSREAFASLMLEHRHPGTGEQLRSPSKVLAYDFTFSAPKSVSVLYAVADEDVSLAMRDAHDEAVAAALGYLEQEAVFSRRGKGGVETIRTSGLVAAGYRHRMSREGDAHLHTHVVAANLTRGTDGRWASLSGYPAFQHAKAAGCVYQAHLRWAVRERLPWVSWGAVEQGMAEIDGVPEEVLREFSQRRGQILGWVDEHGESAAGLRNENAVMATRARKTYGIETPVFHDEARARAGEFGFGQAERAALETGPATEPVVSDGAAARDAFARGGQGALDARLARELAGPAGLTRMRNTFEPRRAVEAIAGAARQGAPAAVIAERTHETLAAPGFVPVETSGRYTTDDLLAHEERIVDGYARRRGEHAGRVDAATVGRVLESWPVTLNDGQREVVEHLTRSGDGFEHVEALAGTGKTTMLGATAEIYRQAGYRVLGVAKTGRAVRELKERAGIPDSRTGQSMLMELERFGGGLGSEATVLLFDEAGMCETREAARILAYAETARVKVLAVGDSAQLTSVEAGGWLGALTRRYGAPTLTEVMRQRDPAERRVLSELRDGRPEKYVAHKRGRGELTVHVTSEQAERAAIAAWQDAQAGVAHGQAVMVSRDNARRHRLNAAARLVLQNAGLLPTDGVEIAGTEYVVGDRVIARRNDRLRDVDNGMRATVAAIDPDTGTVTIEADSGGRRELDRGYVEEHLEHAYALTGHGTQGGTVERAIVIGGPEDFSRNWGYTALSRARESTQVMLIAERAARPGREENTGEELYRSSEQTLDTLARRLREPDAEDLALEQLERAATSDPDVETGVDAVAERAVTPTEGPEAGAEANATEIARAAADTAARLRAERDEALRDRIEVPDPLAAHRRALGAERAEALPAPTETGKRWLAALPDSELEAMRESNAAAAARLDRAAAMHAKGAELAIRATTHQRDQARAEADQLRGQLAGTGRFQRRERGGLEHTLHAREASHDTQQAKLDEHHATQEQLRAEDRHPDQWLERDGTSAVRWAAATHELAVRRELTAEHAGELAVTHPPEHIHDLLGPPPHAGADHERWEELTRSLERHRIIHQLDITDHEPLGPDPHAPELAEQPGHDHAAYTRDHDKLTRDVQDWRAQRGLEEHRAAPAPDMGLEL